MSSGQKRNAFHRGPRAKISVVREKYKNGSNGNPRILSEESIARVQTPSPRCCHGMEYDTVLVPDSVPRYIQKIGLFCIINMESGSVHSCPGTVEKLFQDFKGRRAGLIKALTMEVDEFYDRSDPEKGNLCLFGYPDGSWDVNRPADEVPPELPEPLLGINFAREEMQKYEWLSLVAAHSDAWLMAISSYIGARSGFRKNERKRLFGLINELPTVYEVTVSSIEKQTKDDDRFGNDNHRGCKNKSSLQQLAEIQGQLHLLTNQHKQTLQELVRVKAELAELKAQLKQRDDELAQAPLAQSAKEIPIYVQMKNLMKIIKSEMMGKDEEIRRLGQLLQSSQEKGRGMSSKPS